MISVNEDCKNYVELHITGRNKPFRCSKALSYKRRILTIWYNVVVVKKGPVNGR